MKNKKVFLPAFMTLAVLAGCSMNNNTTEQQASSASSQISSQETTSQSSQSESSIEENSSSEMTSQSSDSAAENSGEQAVDLTQQEVLEAIGNELYTDAPIKLPKQLPMKEGKHLSATASSKSGMYAIVFYESDEPIPINNEQLTDGTSSAEEIARLTVQQYPSQKEADEQIAHQTFSEQGGQEVDLGYDIKGYQDAGAGSVYTGWNEGQWALASHARTENSEQGAALAKEAVEFLENNLLPIPDQHGFAHLDAEQGDNRILWQDRMTVYTIDQVVNPIDALMIAVAFD
ncbi:hypothetical protein JHE06_01695 [Carnobacterium sp. CS13]|uniref:hypothetical protein n=1 Tax=Carnobacterium sp. CS13 TaxID=2800128 RepID=UPI001913DEB5|nr:hypothetical protein [Carnobacterium sp. CS13]QQP70561.1 hypothetical protein JHE06_01695 [Carnobacterium sp. CS13]